MQREIVRILDTFAALTDTLTEELDCRRQQYAYYRDRLLSRESLEAMDGKQVEYNEIGIVLNYEQPTKYLVSSKDYSDNYATPVLTAGKTFVLGYTSETDGIYQASKKSPVIIFDDFTTDFKWVDFPFKAKSSGMKMLTAADENLATIRYAYYAMQMISFSPLDHKRHWISEYSHFEIPVPSLETQRKVVCILDRFDALTTSLTDGIPAEIEARRAQYAYYRDRLLDFPRKAIETEQTDGNRATAIGLPTPVKFANSSRVIWWRGGKLPA